jgi:hypothetical protein
MATFTVLLTAPNYSRTGSVFEVMVIIATEVSRGKTEQAVIAVTL